MRTKGYWRRASALLLCVVLILALSPSSACAAGNEFKGYVGFGEGFDGNYAGLTGVNWMSGIPDDRYLHEINIPGTHDSGMKDAYWDGTLGSFGKSYALTQSLTISQQLNCGVRRFDLRLTDETPDDGQSYSNSASDPLLFIGHGDYTEILGVTIDFCYYAKYSGNTKMLLGLAMGDIKNFLINHPTETVIVQLKHEFGNSDTIYSRVKSYLDTLSAEQNPSTGKSLIYTENGDPILTKIPKMGDVRGQMIIVNSSSTSNRNKMGYGLVADLGNTQSTTTIGDKTFEYENHWELTANDKRDQLNSFYWPNNGKQQIPRDLTTHLARGYNCVSSSNKPTSESPSEIAQTCNANLSSWYDGYVGKYFGWVDSDFVTAELVSKLWKTNFPSDLRYSDIVLYSRENAGKSDSYRIMTGGTYTLPSYPYSSIAGKEFLGWEVGGTSYAPGDVITVNGNTTVTARWRYTVSFNAMGHGTAPATQKAILGGTVAEPAALTATGWDFGGWYTDSACTQAYDFSKAVDDTLVLFAKWTVKQYTVKFVNADGTVLQSGKAAYGDVPNYTGATPAKAADSRYTYTFAGWTPVITAVTGDITYTATYTMAPILHVVVDPYTIVFSSADPETDVVSPDHFDTTAIAQAVADEVSGSSVEGAATIEVTVSLSKEPAIGMDDMIPAGEVGTVYEVHPVAAYVVKDAHGDEIAGASGEFIVGNDSLSGSFTFNLYLDSAVFGIGDDVAVTHYKADGTSESWEKKVQLDTEGVYVRLTFSEFSTIVVTRLNSASPHYYATVALRNGAVDLYFRRGLFQIIGKVDELFL